MFLVNKMVRFSQTKVLHKLLMVLLLLFCFENVQSQTSIKKLRKEIEIIEHHKNFSPKDTVYLYKLTDLAFSLRYHNWDSVLLLSQKTLKLSKNAGYIEGKGYSYMLLGDYYSDKGRYKKSFEYYHKALAIFKNTKNYTVQVDVSNMIGRAYDYNDEPAKALLEYMECIEICNQKLKGKQKAEMLAMTFSNLGQLYTFYLKDYDQGIYFLNEGKKIDAKIKDYYFYNVALSNLAISYLMKGDLDKAMSYLKPSTVYFEKIEDLEFVLLNYTIKAGVLIKKEKFDEALIWLNKLEKLHQHMQDDKSLVTFYIYKATMYLNDNKLNTADKYAHKAYELSKKIHLNDGIIRSLNTLYLVYKQKGDFDAALKYHEQFQRIKDTILKKENRGNLNALLAKIEFDEKKRKIIQENEMALAKQNRYIVLALIVLWILFCTVFILWKNAKTQEKLNVQLRFEKEKLEKNEIVLREANRTKDKLFSIIGHDLRSPISAFQGLLRLFKLKEIDEDEFVSFVPKLESDLGGISFMLNNLLSWGRSQMNGDTTKPEAIEVKSLVDENINLLSEVADNKSITVTNEIANHVLIWGDVNQIDIVFRNLMNNALKFTANHGVITIGVNQENDTYTFYVKDTGVGMDEEILEKIFTENTTHTTYGTHNEKGTGLGLQLCKEMVQKNNGTIWVESKPNVGSCFYIELPKRQQIYKNAG